jgi:hypothetical protein
MYTAEVALQHRSVARVRCWCMDLVRETVGDVSPQVCKGMVSSGLQHANSCRRFEKERTLGEMTLKVSFMFSSIQLDRNTNLLSGSIVRLSITDSSQSVCVTLCIPSVVATWPSVNDFCTFEDAVKSPQLLPRSPDAFGPRSSIFSIYFRWLWEGLQPIRRGTSFHSNSLNSGSRCYWS